MHDTVTHDFRTPAQRLADLLRLERALGLPHICGPTCAAAAGCPKDH